MCIKIKRYIIERVKVVLIILKRQMIKLNWLDYIALILVIVGGLNWGLVAFKWNLVDAIFGVGSILSTVVYGLVGLSALYTIYIVKKVSMPRTM